MNHFPNQVFGRMPLSLGLPDVFLMGNVVDGMFVPLQSHMLKSNPSVILLGVDLSPFLYFCSLFNPFARCW